MTNDIMLVVTFDRISLGIYSFCIIDIMVLNAVTMCKVINDVGKCQPENLVTCGADASLFQAPTLVALMWTQMGYIPVL